MSSRFRSRFKSNEEYNNWFKEYRKRFPEKWRNYRKEWRKKNGHDYLKYMNKYPHKYRAHRLVLDAVRTGLLIRRPCEGCGEKRSQAHHEDYSKPLEIIWLCQECHSLRHKNVIHRRRVKTG